MKKIYHKVKRYQQTDLNCGPNSLAQLLSFYGDNKTPQDIIRKTSMIKGLGTYDAHLGVTAIKLGYKVKITSHNLYAFDPTWYKFSKINLISKLQKFSRKLKDKLLKNNVEAFILFLKSGGEIEFNPISKELLISKIEKYPILIGLCSTYLYKEERFDNWNARFRYGHFVVLNGYDPKTDNFFITDPWHSIPFSKTGCYNVKSEELITAIYLGEATYDCTVLEVWK